jgi:hypothetical protein
VTRSESGSAQWQLRFFPHQRIDLIARVRGVRRHLWQQLPTMWSSPKKRNGATEWRNMRVTVSHNGRKEEIMRSVDRSFDDLFKGFGTVPIKIVNETRSWTGSRMDFSFHAKVGMVSTPIKGFVDVTERDVTVDADLGWLERLFPAKQTQAALEGRIKGLLT